MQTIYLDLAEKNVQQPIYAKQGDVGRKFEAVLLDNGIAYTIERGTYFSVWYNGTSGEGNYTSVGDGDAVTFHDNVLQVELISQMLTCHGGGTLCLVMHSCDGSQIGLWNLLYFCEPVPGLESEEATKHYTAISQIAQKAIEAAQTFATDPSLHLPGVAADAQAVGTELRAKAPSGYGIGAEIFAEAGYVTDLNDAALHTGFHRCSASTLNAPDDSFGGGPLLVVNWRNEALTAQYLWNNDLTQMYHRQYVDGVWSVWQYLNPPMALNTEYATFEKWNGSTVYTKLIYCGSCANDLFKSFNQSLQIVRYSGRIGGVAVPAMTGNPGSPTFYANFTVNSNGILVSCSESVAIIGMPVYCQIWYIKE